MKERILQIMQWQNMSQNEFAAAIKISAASLSSIINGHNNPTMKYVYAIKERFPQIDTEWLLFGRGEMLKHDAVAEAAPVATQPTIHSQAQSTQGQLFDDLDMAYPTTQPTNHNVAPAQHKRAPQPVQQPVEVVKNSDTYKRHIKEIRIYFDDDTYATFSGRM